MSRRSLALLAISALLLSISFILQHYLRLTDAVDGFVKGAAIGLTILSFLLTRQRKQEKQNEA